MPEIKLFDHQQRAVETSRTHNRFGFFWKPGTGKTIAMLAICKERPKRTLVIATKSIVETAWIKDGQLMGVPVVSGMATKMKRRKILQNESIEVVAINYDQFRIEHKFIAECGFERFIFDESSMLKNNKSKTFEAAAYCSWRTPNIECYLLTGTPAPNSPIEVWSQLYLINRKAAGGTFWKFAHHFFNPIKQTIRVKGGKTKTVTKGWEFKHPGAQSAFEAHLRLHSEALLKKDCVDLPEFVDALIYVDLGKNERNAYESMRDDTILSFLKDPSAPVSMTNLTLENVNAQGATMKLRQLTGGTVHTKTGVQAVGTSKLDALSAWLDEVGPDEHVLIWAEFTAEINAIANMLAARGERCDIIDGRTKGGVAPIIERFQSGRTKRIIAHPQSAGHGTDGLQRVCQYAVFYSMSWSSEYHEQARDRLHRNGQEGSVTFVYLVVQDTIDESVYATVTGKMSGQEALLMELSRNRK